MSSHSKIRLVTGALAVSATLTVIAAMASSALGSAEHPQFYESGEGKKGGVKVPVLGWGTISLQNRVVGTVQCATTLDSDAFNSTEPGGSFERAYGDVLGLSTTSNMNTSGQELSPRCKASAGFVAWVTPEPPLELSTEKATVAGQEREVIRNVVRGNPSLPWHQEAEGTESSAREKAFYLKTGVATSGRAAVEAEEAGAGVPTELRSGCYPNPPVTEIVREPGFNVSRETEQALRPAPAGCIRSTVQVPEIGLELPFQGTLEPQVTNGVKNGLNPSSAEFKGGSIEEQTESSLERNGRHLESAFGAWYAKSLIPTKGLGFLHEELLQLK